MINGFTVEKNSLKFSDINVYDILDRLANLSTDNKELNDLKNKIFKSKKAKIYRRDYETIVLSINNKNWIVYNTHFRRIMTSSLSKKNQ